MSNLLCPYCGEDHVLAITVLHGEVMLCDACGNRFDEDDVRIENYVREKFAAMFPPGSDGPLSDFDMGGLYADAHEWLAHQQSGAVDGLPLTFEDEFKE